MVTKNVELEKEDFMMAIMEKYLTITKDAIREALKQYGIELSNTQFKKTKKEELVLMLEREKQGAEIDRAKIGVVNDAEESQSEEVPVGDFSKDKHYPEEQVESPEDIAKREREALDEELLKEFKVKGISLAHRNSLKKKIWNDAVSVTITSTKNGEEVKEIRLHILEKKLNQIIKNEYKDEYAEYFEKYGVIPNTILKRIKDILCYYEFLKFRPTEVYDKNRRRTVENRYYINKELCNPYLTEQAEQK
jgi:hypothetical protein